MSYSRPPFPCLQIERFAQGSQTRSTAGVGAAESSDVYLEITDQIPFDYLC